MSLDIRCTKKTNKISETNTYFGGLSEVQYVDPETDKNFFVLPAYSMRSDYCASVNYIEVRKGSDQNSTYLLMETRAVADGSTWILKPLN